MVVLASALNLGGGTFTLDAACASSLFAVSIKIGSDEQVPADPPGQTLDLEESPGLYGLLFLDIAERDIAGILGQTVTSGRASRAADQPGALEL